MFFKHTCALTIANESALIHFSSGKFCSYENLMPAWNFISVKMTDLKSMPFWVSFCLKSCEHKQWADWTPKWFSTEMKSHNGLMPPGSLITLSETDLIATNLHVLFASEAALQRCSYKKVFWKYAVKLQENTHADV